MADELNVSYEHYKKIENGNHDYYNEFVKKHLPHSFRTGIIPRAVLWEREPEWSYRKTEKHDGERFLLCLCDWL